MNRKVTIERETNTPDGQGGFTITRTTIATNIPGRRVPVRAGTLRRDIAGIEDAQVTHNWFVESNTNIKVRDRIIDGNIEYEVLFTSSPSIDDFINAETREIQRG
ncbi:MAG: head-tail adaptor protein [Nitrosopumilaceae archaeon]|nr:head-tail adaptor protein [Nitrosopumilaceae archaeon]NIU87791.1 head-tail adaptor protein [Nitrosopumilaceae archaeon]NIV65174.1 head-tail adaptor protein [Nitrosopumilaceae archaeon]NIX61689.1 head-tail adaptor protein [Nitrosopumilaceae archaeon]